MLRARIQWFNPANELQYLFFVRAYVIRVLMLLILFCRTDRLLAHKQTNTGYPSVYMYVCVWEFLLTKFTQQALVNLEIL